MTLRREDNARQGFFDPADFDALLAELRAREPVVADVAECAYFTCLRRGNVLGPTWPMLAPLLKRGRLAGGVCASRAGSRRTAGPPRHSPTCDDPRVTSRTSPVSRCAAFVTGGNQSSPLAPRASASAPRDAASSVRRGSHFA